MWGKPLQKPRSSDRRPLIERLVARSVAAAVAAKKAWRCQDSKPNTELAEPTHQPLGDALATPAADDQRDRQWHQD